ncbi:MAG: dTDP-glucose 4,6-dehydratase [Deltaproteobacteria bacterium]|nr:MAG: dTDP-glucose 4,6-dehydratase [Deltaproteobacteria bacterium]
MKILVTGGAGFIGSNFIYYMLHSYPDIQITNLDKLTYAGNLENLAIVEKDSFLSSRYKFIKGDIADAGLIDRIMAEGFDAIINFAAESHVDRSIEDAGIFLKTNVLGTQNLLEGLKKHKIERFIQISTDEVYGSLGSEGKFTEHSPLMPNSPYSASKASADLICRAYFRTFHLPIIITRCSNNYGPYQFPEKLIPLFITNALEDLPLPLYGDGLNIRDWIHVEDHCRAIDLVLRKGREGEIYNIGGNCEKTNLEITRIILEKLNKPETLITFVKDRPGHDRRYAISMDKIEKELGWKPTFSFEVGIEKTINWYQENSWWWQKIKSGEYRKYYERRYGKIR